MILIRHRYKYELLARKLQRLLEMRFSEMRVNVIPQNAVMMLANNNVGACAVLTRMP